MWLIRIVPLLFVSVVLISCVSLKEEISREKQASAHYKLGIAYLNENSLQKAFVEFQQALDISPKDKSYLYAMGHVYFRQGHHAKGEDMFRKAIRVDPNYSEAHNYLGKVLVLQGMHDEAVVEYKEALKNPLYSTPQKPYINLGEVYTIRGQYQEALDAYSQVLRLDPSCSDFACVPAHNGLGKTYFQMGQIKEAIDAYHAAIKAFPAYVDAHYNLAFAYLKQGEKGLAAAEFRKVIELFPESDLAEDSRKLLEALN